MSVFETIQIIVLLLAVLAIVWLITEVNSLKKRLNESNQPDPETQKLRLQAYERMALLSERIALPNLITRTPASGLSSRQMQSALVANIKEEFEYNLSQQIYISTEIWKGIGNLKEQNIYIINQIASILPPNASAMDLNKQIVEFMVQNNPQATLHKVVLDAINYEAHKLM